MAGWEKHQYGDGFDLDTGAMRLSVTDQSSRDCGWCWHVLADHSYGDEVGHGGGLATVEDAKSAAITFARNYCEMTLAAL